jgi:hypothetical protein
VPWAKRGVVWSANRYKATGTISNSEVTRSIPDTEALTAVSEEVSRKKLKEERERLGVFFSETIRRHWILCARSMGLLASRTELVAEIQDVAGIKRAFLNIDGLQNKVCALYMLTFFIDDVIYPGVFGAEHGEMAEDSALALENATTTPRRQAMPTGRKTFLGSLFGDKANKIRRSLIHSVLNVRELKMQLVRSKMMGEGDFVTMSVQSGPLIHTPANHVRSKDRCYLHVKRSVTGDSAVFLRSVEVIVNTHPLYGEWHGNVTRMLVAYFDAHRADVVPMGVEEESDDDNSVGLMNWFVAPGNGTVVEVEDLHPVVEVEVEVEDLRAVVEVENLQGIMHPANDSSSDDDGASFSTEVRDRLLAAGRDIVACRGGVSAPPVSARPSTVGIAPKPTVGVAPNPSPVVRPVVATRLVPAAVVVPAQVPPPPVVRPVVATRLVPAAVVVPAQVPNVLPPVVHQVVPPLAVATGRVPVEVEIAGQPPIVSPVGLAPVKLKPATEPKSPPESVVPSLTTVLVVPSHAVVQSVAQIIGLTKTTSTSAVVDSRGAQGFGNRLQAFVQNARESRAEGEENLDRQIKRAAKTGTGGNKPSKKAKKTRAGENEITTKKPPKKKTTKAGTSAKKPLKKKLTVTTVTPPNETTPSPILVKSNKMCCHNTKGSQLTSCSSTFRLAYKKEGQYFLLVNSCVSCGGTFV